MTLSKRLQAIYDMVPYAVTADIGSDHGKLMIALFNDGKIPKGYAVENKKGPYDRLVKALKEVNIDEDVVPLFSDGISELPTSVGTIVLAGMGGDTILKILLDHKENLKHVQTIIIDAHTNVPYIRKKVCDLGYIISDEKMVEEDDIYYEIIKFIKSDTAFYSESELEFGPVLSKEKSDVFKAKYKKRIDEIDNLLHKNLPNEKIIKLTQEKERISSLL